MTPCLEMKAVSFNDDMVRAILEGRKTQTRRPMKKQKRVVSELSEVEGRGLAAVGGDTVGHIFEYSPFGKVGDLLWVRESATVTDIIGHRRVKFRYEADGAKSICRIPERINGLRVGNKMPNGIFKEAARTFLRVKRVWVERIQEISGADARAEGIEKYTYGTPMDEGGWGTSVVYGTQRLALGVMPGSAIEAYRRLWQSIYGEDAWKSNQWVWAASFERVVK